jgi:hypothetical protein
VLVWVLENMESEVKGVLRVEERETRKKKQLVL